MAKNKEIKKAGAAQGQSRSKQRDSSKGAAKQPAKGSSSREADARDAGKQEARDGAFISAEQVLEARDPIQSTPGTSDRGQDLQSGRTAQDGRVSRSRSPLSRTGRKTSSDGSVGSPGSGARRSPGGEKTGRRDRSSRRDRSHRPRSVDAYGAVKPRRPREDKSKSPSRRHSLNPFRGLVPCEFPGIAGGERVCGRGPRRPGILKLKEGATSGSQSAAVIAREATRDPR